MNKETFFGININELDNPFEREKLESLPKYILVELLVRHLKREIKAIEYIKDKQELNKMFGNITLSKESQKELLEILGDKEWRQ